MIKSFKHRGLEEFFFYGRKKNLQSRHLTKLEDILDLLNAAGNIKDINFPGSGLHQLKGNFKGHWAVKISGNWRLTFKFENANAYEVNLIDYH
jgi:proteic killer suppression protein